MVGVRFSRSAVTASVPRPMARSLLPATSVNFPYAGPVMSMSTSGSHKGSPTICGEEGEEGDVDDSTDFNYPSIEHEPKQKMAVERMIGRHYGPPLKFDSGELSHGHDQEVVL